MYDEDWVRKVLSEAETDPAPPSTVDAQLAVRDGRRRRRSRRAAGSMVVAGVTALAVAAVPTTLGYLDRAAPPDVMGTPTSAPPERPSPPPVPTQCTPAPLPMPPGVKDGQVLGGDPTGRYLVGAVANLTRAVLWDNGKVEVVQAPGDDMVHGVLVNSSGMLTFTSRDSANRVTHWIRRDGTFIKLTAPAGDYQVSGINARGDVIANWVWSQDATEADVRPPLLWPAGSPHQPRELKGGIGVVSVSGIDDDGTVVGTSRDWVEPVQVPTDPKERMEWLGRQKTPPPQPRMEPIYWSPDGTVHELPVPDGYGPAASAGIIRGGLVAGKVKTTAEPNTTPEVAITWHISTGSVMVIDEMWSADGMNRHGWMVGRSSAFVAGAFIGGQARQLPLPKGADYDASSFSTISDDGRIIGGSTGSSSSGPGITKTLPTRWTCSS